MAKQSAALLPYRLRNGVLEVFLVHLGGPFWARKDDGAWLLPKGEYELTEDPLAAACREFTEETGFVAEGEFLPLDAITQKAGKLVTAWAVAFDADPALLKSNTFSMEWPKGSGRTREFPEVDRAAWFSAEAARRKLLPAQLPFIDRLERLVGKGRGDA